MNNDIVKKGADYLLRGGTLLSEPCQICNGLLIKFKGNIMCLNCQKSNLGDSQTTNASNVTTDKKEVENHQKPQTNANVIKINGLHNAENYDGLLLKIKDTIMEKVFESNKAISIENDLDKQQKNLNVLFSYLKILKKIKEIQ